MMSIDLIAKNILEYMIDLERFGWPPTCADIGWYLSLIHISEPTRP